jgi:hypothetical protein
VFIPGVTLEEAITVTQDYANYKHRYQSILDADVLEQDGETFRLLIRLHQRASLVSAVLDVWSVVRYVQPGHVVYSVSDAERIAEVKNAGEPNEHRLPPGQDSGYLWRARIFRAAPNEMAVWWWKSRTSASAEASRRCLVGSSSQLPGESAGAASKTLSWSSERPFMPHILKPCIDSHGTRLAIVQPFSRSEFEASDRSRARVRAFGIRRDFAGTHTVPTGRLIVRLRPNTRVREALHARPLNEQHVGQSPF